MATRIWYISMDSDASMDAGASLNLKPWHFGFWVLYRVMCFYQSSAGIFSPTNLVPYAEQDWLFNVSSLSLWSFQASSLHVPYINGDLDRGPLPSIQCLNPAGYSSMKAPHPNSASLVLLLMLPSNLAPVAELGLVVRQLSFSIFPCLDG